MSTWTAPASEIVAKYRPPYPWSNGDHPTWESTIQLLTSTEADRARLDALRADIAANGQQESVRLWPGGCDPRDEECTGQPECCPPKVLNGTHRIAVALLAGGDVTVTDDPWPEQDGTEVCTITTVSYLPPTDPDVDGEVFDLLSFRVSPDLWLTTSFASNTWDGALRKSEIYWDFDAAGHEGTIHDHLRDLFSRLGAVVVGVESRQDTLD